MLNAPARMRFKYGIGAEPKKQFTWDGSKGWLFINLVSDNGVDMTRYLINDTMDVDMEHGPIVTIWYYNSSDNNWEMMLSAECDLVRWNQDGKKDLRLHVEPNGYRVGQANFAGNYKYYITLVGGLF